MDPTREAGNPSTPRCLLSVSAGASLQGAARNPRAKPHEHSTSLGQGWSSGGCSALVSCAPNRKSGPLIPSLSFPPPLKKVLPAQVARSARRRSTSRLHERARYVWRRGIVKRLLRYRLEGHFRSLSCKTRICNVCDALTEQWGVRHDLYARMRELSSKFEGVETVDVGTLSRRVRGRTRKSGYHLTSNK